MLSKKVIKNFWWLNNIIYKLSADQIKLQYNIIIAYFFCQKIDLIKKINWIFIYFINNFYKLSVIKIYYTLFQRLEFLNKYYFILFKLIDFFNKKIIHIVSTLFSTKKINTVVIENSDIFEKVEKYQNFFFKRELKHQEFLRILMNKFMLKGRKYLIEKRFNELLCSNKSYYLYYFLYEAIEILRPCLDLKVYTFKKRGKKRSVKKGTRVVQHVKIIPVEITKVKSYKIAFKWLVKAILTQKSEPFKNSLVKVIKETYYKTYNSSAVLYKKQAYQTAAINRQGSHYRWKNPEKWL